MSEKLNLDALEQQANRVLRIAEFGHSAHEDQNNIIALIARVRELENHASQEPVAYELTYPDGSQELVYAKVVDVHSSHSSLEFQAAPLYHREVAA